jgi:cardiolipin synthase
MILTLPNILTISRVLVIPVFVALFFVEATWAPWAALGVFAAAAVTDFLDGLIARRAGQYSEFGRFLDPLADKLLVAAALLILAGFGNIAGATLIAAAIILLREIVVSGLREFLGGLHIVVKVTPLAKWKTTIQMVALGFLIVGKAGPEGFPTVLVGEVLLWLAAALTVVTGYDYLRAGLKHIVASDVGDAAKQDGARPAE